MKTTEFVAPDIECGGCANSIKRAMGKVEGVSEVGVDVASKRVRITHEEAVTPEQLTGVLDRAGFPVEA